ncbi:uncharacterized protein LOC133306305 [Gastrolobium bilobum]|uniref:uncharacterized protein LOC133306305 n=1 Tax=Gastrolobium bilobum TaxID=150636 RepID=UPI002AB28B08|nr:uncharacterized protein LOC133306305 [Gastrolobium bilobum]
MADSSVAVAFALALAVFVELILAGDSSARELRPSDHGLVFQTLSPAGAHSSPEMRSFFNNENSSPTMSSSSDVALPRAMNSGQASPPSWFRSAAGDRGDGVGKALTVASLVCGMAGAVLLVASGLIYLFKYRKHKLNAAFRGDNVNINEDHGENNDDNKLQLVVRDP